MHPRVTDEANADWSKSGSRFQDKQQKRDTNKNRTFLTPIEDPQCSTHIHGLINAVTIHPKQQCESHDDKPEENEEEEKDNPEKYQCPTLPTELVCTKGDDGDVMFIEIVKTNEDSYKEEPEVGEQEVEAWFSANPNSFWQQTGKKYIKRNRFWVSVGIQSSDVLQKRGAMITSGFIWGDYVLIPYSLIGAAHLLLILLLRYMGLILLLLVISFLLIGFMVPTGLLMVSSAAFDTSIEQFLNNFANQPNETNMNDLESDDESVDTPLVSPFPHLDNDSDDGEVLNELIEYVNIGMLRREKEINSFDGDDLAFQCMIGFRKSIAYFDPFLPINIITRKAYNTKMVEGLEVTGKNLVAVVRDVYVFVGSFTYIMDFVVLEYIGEFIQINKAEIVMGKPFRKITKLEYDCAKGLMYFNRIFDNYTFQMPCTILRKFLIKNEEEIFTDSEDDPDAVASPVIFDKQKLGRS
ncbi:hypothetical protein Tco_0705232 [Tanacetum coccineum]|uniref:Protein kinase-like domain, concanavalin A-like lectin/glucanase domain protein n=1 Tax=Tanacetum coccineum TaxID=301880 RepID=A0ABQ4Y5D8_9ASTR